MMERILLIVGTIAAVITAIPAIYFLVDRYFSQPQTEPGDPMPVTSATGRFWLGIGFSIVSAIILGMTLGGLWFFEPRQSPHGFNPPWPDAIACSFKESNGENFGSNSDLIFYTRGHAISRGSFGAVIIYFMPGGEVERHNGEHFFAHEIWFRAEEPHSIVIPPEARSRDILIANYQDNFPEVDCGTGFRNQGLEKLTIEAVKRKYVFARPQ